MTEKQRAEKRQQLQIKERRLQRLLSNFENFPKDDAHELDDFLDWMNKLKREIAKLEKELNE